MEVDQQTYHEIARKSELQIPSPGKKHFVVFYFFQTHLILFTLSIFCRVSAS